MAWPGLGLPDVDGKVPEVPHDGLGLGGLLEQVYWQLRHCRERFRIAVLNSHSKLFPGSFVGSYLAIDVELVYGGV